MRAWSPRSSWSTPGSSTRAHISSRCRRGAVVPLVALLWGRDAQQAERLLPGVPVIKSPHPSPLSAHNGFFGSRPFSRVNQALEAQGAQPIDWRIPA